MRTIHALVLLHHLEHLYCNKLHGFGEARRKQVVFGCRAIIQHSKFLHCDAAPVNFSFFVRSQYNDTVASSINVIILIL
jgi:hypothetical protein